MLNDRIFDNDEILIDPPLSQQEQHVLVNKRLDWARSVETATRYECADLEERHHHALLDARIAQSFKRRLQVEQTAWVSSMLAKHAMIANRESMANMSLQERSFTLATAISRDTGSSKFSATACSFLTLPTEIRIKIYEALFAGRHINVFEHEEYHESAICESAAKRHFCQILLTCKKFCLEGTPVMYSTATWIVPWTPHFQHTLLTRSSTVSLELIRKIVFNYNPFQSEELTPRGFHNIRARRWATYQQQHLRRFPYQLFPNLESLILDCTEKELKFDSREQIDSIRSFENMFQAYYNGGDWRDPSNETPDYGGHCADEVKSAIPENRKFEISLLVLWSDSVKIPDVCFPIPTTRSPTNDVH
jgi:hypothetical protein